MESKADPIRSILISLCALLATAALLFFGTGLHPVWWLTWVAPLPVLLMASRARALPAFGIATVSWFVGGLNMWRFLVGLLHINAAMVVLFLGATACVFGLVVLAHRTFVRRGACWLAALSVPAIWVTFEYVISVVSPHGTFGNISYSQMDCLPVLQIASVTGVWGISFCVFLFPAAVSATLSRRRNSAQNNRLAIATAGFLALIVLFGFWRLNSGARDGQSITVALMASDVPANVFPESDACTLQLLHNYAEQLERFLNDSTGNRASIGDLVVVLPEKIGVISDQSTGEIDSLFQSTSHAANATIVVGIDRGTQTQRFNEARVYSPRGELSATYQKHHLIPGFEDVDQPGSARTLIDQPTGAWGVEICKDLDFPLLGREYGNDGVALLIVPAWDFVLDGWLHDRMAVMRGVESGFTLLRAAKQGLLTVSDNRGRVLAQANSATAPFSFLIAKAPAQHVDTFYARWGDWFAWLNMALLLTMLANSLIKSKR